MGNVVDSIVSGFGQIIGKILGHPLDFLSGKSCKSACGSTWDFICYIENFCVAQLLKMAMVAMLFYFVLLFFYLLYNLGICQCICHTFCRIVWACFATYFSALESCCTSLCHRLRMVKRKRKRRRRKRRRDIKESATPSTSASDNDYELGECSTFHQSRNFEHGRLQSSRRRNYKNEHLRKSLRPTTHLAYLKLSGNSIHLRGAKILNSRGDHASTLHHHICVTRSSKLSQKGTRHRTRIHHRRRLTKIHRQREGRIDFCEQIQCSSALAINPMIDLNEALSNTRVTSSNSCCIPGESQLVVLILT